MARQNLKRRAKALAKRIATASDADRAHLEGELARITERRLKK